MKILAIIPARSGSKGIKNKNIIDFGGHPLLSWSISSALKSSKVTDVICSTDSEEIASIARSYGASVPVLRPKELAQDLSLDIEFLKHVLTHYEEDELPEFIVLLRPTSPLRRDGLIDEAIEKLINSNADSLKSIVELDKSPYKMWSLNGEELEPLPLQKLEHSQRECDLPRQILPKFYIQAGVIDVIRTSTVLEMNSSSGEKIISFMLEKDEFVDIDSMDDLDRSFSLLSEKNYEKPKKI